jgi:hypothetical protein
MPLHRRTLALILQDGIPASTTFLAVLVLTAVFRNFELVERR